MRAVGTGPVTGLLCQFAVTVGLAATVGLGALGWVVGISYGVIANLLLAWGLARHGADRLGPADRVTLIRATLAGGVTALVADSFSRPTPVTALVALTIIALVLDAVDGWVARRTMTTSALGARFDGEVDAFLILVLSVYVTHSTGGWVLAIGIARYAFLAAGWVLPWMGGTLPPRYWRKVVAAIQGIALTFAVPAVLPRFLADAVLAVSLALLVESFGRDVVWLWRRRHVESGRVRVSAGSPERTREREHHVAPLPSKVAVSHPRGTSTQAVRRHRPAWRQPTLGWPAGHERRRADTEVGDG